MRLACRRLLNTPTSPAASPNPSPGRSASASFMSLVSCEHQSSKEWTTYQVNTMLLTFLGLMLSLNAPKSDAKPVEQAATALFDLWKAGQLKDAVALFAGNDVSVTSIQRLGKAGRVQVPLAKWLSGEQGKPESVRISVGEVNGSLAAATVKFKLVTTHQAFAVITLSNAEGNGWKIVSLVLHYDRIW
jgi:hypothetical protein